MQQINDNATKLLCYPSLQTPTVMPKVKPRQTSPPPQQHTHKDQHVEKGIKHIVATAEDIQETKRLWIYIFRGWEISFKEA